MRKQYSNIPDSTKRVNRILKAADALAAEKKANAAKKAESNPANRADSTTHGARPQRTGLADVSRPPKARLNNSFFGASPMDTGISHAKSPGENQKRSSSFSSHVSKSDIQKLARKSMRWEPVYDTARAGIEDLKSYGVNTVGNVTKGITKYAEFMDSLDGKGDLSAKEKKRAAKTAGEVYALSDRYHSDAEKSASEAKKHAGKHPCW